MNIDKSVLIGKLPILVNVFDKAHVPLMIYGGHGIGKSEIIQQTAIEKANRLNKQFIYWDKLSREQKIEAINNPTKYCALIDTRLSGFAPEDIKGIPNIFNKTSEDSFLETIPYSWIIYITRPGASGTLFFDEINLAPPSITAAAYQAINDRVIGDRPISESVNIIAAGNRTCDTTNVYDMVPPLKDRFAEVEVKIDHEAWLKYAFNKIPDVLFSFCSFKTNYIYNIYENGEDKDVTPRGIFRLSRSLKSLYDIRKENNLAKDSIERDMHANIKEYDVFIKACVGFGFATEFKGYIKCYNTIKWDVLFSNPDIMKHLTIDEKYAVIGGICDKLSSQCTSDKDDDLTFNLINLMFSLEDELFFLCIKQFFLIDGRKQWIKKFIINPQNPRYADIALKFKTQYVSKIK